MSDVETCHEFFDGRLRSDRPSARDWDYFAQQAIGPMREAAQLVGDSRLSARLDLLAQAFRRHAELTRRPQSPIANPLASKSPWIAGELQKLARAQEVREVRYLLELAAASLQSYDATGAG